MAKSIEWCNDSLPRTYDGERTILTCVWAVVVAQLAERSPPTPEIRGSNLDIGNISNVFTCQLLSRKDENKEKETRNGPLKKQL